MKGIISLATAGLLFLTTHMDTVYAQPFDNPVLQNENKWEGNFGNRKKGFLKELNLTSEQIEKVKSLKQSQKSLKELAEKLKEEREEFQNLIGKSEVTDSIIKAKASSLKLLLGQIIDTRIKQNAALKQILTPEQYSKFHQMMKERKENRRTKGQGNSIETYSGTPR
jgi:Spy/CpxP family protein refolding chaperone